ASTHREAYGIDAFQIDAGLRADGLHDCFGEAHVIDVARVRATRADVPRIVDSVRKGNHQALRVRDPLIAGAPLLLAPRPTERVQVYDERHGRLTVIARWNVQNERARHPIDI